MVAVISLPEELAPSAPASGLVFVLSGPSGVGKDTITQCLKHEGFPLSYCVTVTTRARRPGEIQGVSYHFVTDEEFASLVASGGMLEYAVVHGKNYGIPVEGIRAGLRSGKDVLVTPDVQGAATLREKLPNSISIFLRPASLEDLPARLARRGSEGLEERALRLATAAREMEHQDRYDYVVVNEQGRVHETVAKIKAIVTAERCRVKRRVTTL